MEAAESLRRLIPGVHTGTPSGHDAEIIDFPSQPEEGFLNSERTDANNQVVAVHERSAEDSRYGTVDRKTYEMEDGTLYPVLAGAPELARSDTAIVFTTAWLTSTRGHNMRTFLTMMKHGYPVVMIGPEGEEQNHNHSTGQRFKHAIHNSLTKVSEDMNHITSNRLLSMDAKPDQVIGLGESRGAMTGLGLKNLVYGDFTAPCFPRKAKLQEIPGVLLQLMPEAKTLASLGIDLIRDRRVKHYPATLHSSPEYYAKELLKVPQLWSGQAGELASKIDADTPLHVRIFKNDGWSQAEVWQKLFANHANVHLELSDGYHLDIANKSTLRNITARLDVLAESRGFDGSFGKVDFAEVIGHHADNAKT